RGFPPLTAAIATAPGAGFAWSLTSRSRRQKGPGREVERMPKYRLRYAKFGPARFASHLDLGRALGRALRRAGLPVAYSQGFHPLPKMAFGPPLPVGVESEAEFVDITFT